MSVDPQCQFLLDRMAASPVKMIELEPSAARAAGDAGLSLAAGFAPPVDLAAVTDGEAPGPAGPIPIRVYRPHGDGPLPVVVFFHGGGFVIGSIQTHDTICKLLAATSGAVVVSVDYRLAPEHPFPAGLDDSVAVTEWVANSADELGVDADRLAVCGDSAGGNLAAVVAQRCRDLGAPTIRFQALMYPAVDADRDHHPSVAENAMGYFLERETMDWFQRHYVVDPAGVDPHDPRLSPLRGDLSNVAPAFVVTAGFDPLRDEGEAYVAALADAGVEVAHRRYPGMVHGFWNFIGIVDAATEATVDMADAIRRGLA